MTGLASREEDPLERIRTCNAHGVQCLHGGALDDAQTYFDEVQALFARTQGGVSPRSRARLQRAVVSNQACLLKKRGQFVEAIEWMERELDMSEAACPSTLATYAACLTAAGRCDAAIAACRQGISHVQQKTPPQDQGAFDKEVFVGLFYNLASAQLGSPLERHFADGSFQQAVHFANLFLGSEHPTTVAIKANLAAMPPPAPTAPPRPGSSGSGKVPPRKASQRQSKAKPPRAGPRYSVTEQMLHHPIMYPPSSRGSLTADSYSQSQSPADSGPASVPGSAGVDQRLLMPELKQASSFAESQRGSQLLLSDFLQPDGAGLSSQRSTPAGRPVAPTPQEFSAALPPASGQAHYQHRWRRASDPTAGGDDWTALAQPTTTGERHDMPQPRARSEMTLPSLPPVGGVGKDAKLGEGLQPRSGAGLYPAPTFAPGGDAMTKQKAAAEKNKEQKLKKGQRGKATAPRKGSSGAGKKQQASLRHEGSGSVVDATMLRNRPVPTPPARLEGCMANPQAAAPPAPAQHPPQMNYPYYHDHIAPHPHGWRHGVDPAPLPPIPQRPVSSAATSKASSSGVPDDVSSVEPVYARKVEVNPRSLGEIRREVRGMTPLPPGTPTSIASRGGTPSATGTPVPPAVAPTTTGAGLRKSRFSGQREQRAAHIKQQEEEEERRRAELDAEAEETRQMEEVQTRLRERTKRRHIAAAVAIQKFYRCHLEAQRLTKAITPAVKSPTTDTLLTNTNTDTDTNTNTNTNTSAFAFATPQAGPQDPPVSPFIGTVEVTYVSTAAMHRKYLGMTEAEEVRYTTATVALQAWVRMMLAKFHVAGVRRRAWEKKAAYLWFEKQSISAKVIQKNVRGWLSRKHARMEFLKGPGARILQWYRGYKARQHANLAGKVRRRTQARAAAKIQQAWRGHYAALREADARLRARMAAVDHPYTPQCVTIQRVWRGHVARQHKAFLRALRRTLRDEIPARADLIDEEGACFAPLVSQEAAEHAFLLKYLRYKPRVPQANAFIAECRELKMQYVIDHVDRPHLVERYSHTPLRTQLHHLAVRTSRLQEFTRAARLVLSVLRLQRVFKRWLRGMTADKRILNQRWKDRAWTKRAKEERLQQELKEFRMEQNARRLQASYQRPVIPASLVPHPLAVGDALE